MTLSTQNRALLERKCGRAMPSSDAKISMKLSELAKLLDAARAEGSKQADPNLQAMLDAVFGKAS